MREGTNNKYSLGPWTGSQGPDTVREKTKPQKRTWRGRRTCVRGREVNGQERVESSRKGDWKYRSPPRQEGREKGKSQKTS